MQGGMPPQGPQMPQFGGPQMGPQGPPPPRQGPPQQGPGMGGQVNRGLQNQLQNMPQFGMANMGQQMGPPPAMQQGIDDLQQQLMMAQINGAPPQVLAGLQMQLQQAQRAMQEAGMRAMYEQQQARPQPGLGSVGTGGRGGRPDPNDAQRQQSWQNQLQLLMAFGAWVVAAAQ